MPRPDAAIPGYQRLDAELRGAASANMSAMTMIDAKVSKELDPARKGQLMELRAKCDLALVSARDARRSLWKLAADPHCPHPDA